MAGHTTAQKYSVSSIISISKGTTSATPFLAQLTKNIKKISDTWAKFKLTPPNVAYLIRDLSILSQSIAQTLQEYQTEYRVSPVVEGALRLCIEKSQELVEPSGRFTARFGRRSLSAHNLKNLFSLLSDTKIVFLVTQLLLESRAFLNLTSSNQILTPDRRTKPISQSALAEELAQLHAREIPAQSSKLQGKLIEPRTDSLLSFKCYSELVGREDVILGLDREFEDANTVALVGLDGSGKSQLATEYALRFQNRLPDSHVFWVFCESRTAFEESYRAIAVKLRIPGCDDSRLDILERVRKYLSQERAGKWLLVLDNADDPEVLWSVVEGYTDRYNQQQMHLGTHLPSSPTGKILCLSSDEQIGTRFSDAAITVNANPLLESESTTLFQSKLPKDLDHPKVIAALAGALDFSPLAICLAAAYMVIMRRDASQYLISYKTGAIGSTLKESGLAGDALLSVTLSESSIFKAWALSFAQIQNQHPQAARLFALMAMFHHRAIPKNLLYHAWKHGLVTEDSQRALPDLDIELLPPPADLVEAKERASYLSFSMALATLEAFLIVQYDATHECYSMHRAIQSSLRHYLESSGALRAWRSAALILLSSTSQSLRPPQRSHTRSRSNLFLHVAELVYHAHEGESAALAKARIMSDVGGWRYSMAQTSAATALFQEAYDLQNRLLKPQDVRTLRTLVSLADSKSLSDSASAAVPLLVEAVTGMKHTLGPGSRRTIYAQLSLCANHIACDKAESASTVHYEAQAAASASLQITSEDRKRIVTRLNELHAQINIVLSRQGKRFLSESDLKKKSKSRLSVLKQGPRQRIGGNSKAFSSQNRVASLDSIVELMEVEATKI